MRLVVGIVCLAGILAAQASRDLMNRGVQAFKNAQYGEAVNAFQKAVADDPSSVTAHLYLATAYMQQYIPGAETPENRAFATGAEAEFEKVLGLDAGNRVALSSLASLALNQKQWDRATNWYHRVLTADPGNRDAYYSLGFITWAQWYPAVSAARAKLGMWLETPGPIPDAAVRTNLRAQWWATLEEGIWNLNRALEIDPQYDDAMAYLNLLIRERADLRDTKQEYDQEIRIADTWVQKVIETKRTKAQRPYGSMTPPPSPPPPPAGQTQGHVVGGSAINATVITQVSPIYPPLAVQARIQGIVKFSAIIDQEGHVKNLSVISGHPLLVPAAIEAVKQWVYRPVLVNGEPTEVATVLNVNFTLPN